MDARELREAFETRRIRRVKLGGFDIDGVLRGKYVSLDKFWSAVEKGFGFCDVIFGWDVADQLYDNAELTGWHTGYPDTLARVDLDTFRVLPSEPETAHLLVDFWETPDRPHPACPRNLLKAIVARAGVAGWRPRMALEYEFWIFRESPESLRAKHYRDLEPLSPGMFGYSWVREGQQHELLEDVLNEMTAYGIEIEGLHTETGPGVYEAAIRYADALAAADQAALCKTTLKILLGRRGLTPTFMAKWNPALPGSSGHIHQSLWDAEKNLFSDPTGAHGLSALGRRYLAGLVSTAPDLTALYSPTINSYKRYVPGLWAPLTASWGVENRTCAVRVINGPGASAARLELRQTAADVNPYVAMAASLAAGLHGIAEGREPPPPVGGDATADTGAAPLPRTLAEANARLAGSEIARKILPAAFVNHYVRTRDWEIRQYARTVGDWELDRYFEAI
jgi:glutamine synthetase